MKSFAFRSKEVVGRIISNRKTLIRKEKSRKKDSSVLEAISKLEYVYGKFMDSKKSAAVFINVFDAICVVAPGYGAKNYESIQKILFDLRNEALLII